MLSEINHVKAHKVESCKRDVSVLSNVTIFLTRISLPHMTGLYQSDSWLVEERLRLNRRWADDLTQRASHRGGVFLRALAVK
jgi:hypothetical protein